MAGKRLRTDFGIGEIVHLRTDPQKAARIISRITISDTGVEYGLRLGAGDSTWHTAIELDRFDTTPKTPAGFRLPSQS